MNLFSLSLVLFLIMDPIGNVSSFLTMVKGIEPKRQTVIVFREMLIALLFMIGFNYLGEYIFQWLKVSDMVVKLSSGIILFIISVHILFPKPSALRENIPEGEPFIVPLAVPLIAGPSLLATIMLYAHMDQSRHMMLLAIVIAWLASVLVLLSSRFLNWILGINGLMACEKLMGMILVLLAIQRFLDGVKEFINT